MLARIRRSVDEASSLISPFGSTHRRIAACTSRKSPTEAARAASKGNFTASSRNCCRSHPPDPQDWLERIEGPGMALEPGEFLDAASLLERGGWLRQQFREEAVKFPLLAARAASVGDFRDVQAAIRRCVLPNGEISDDASSTLRRIRASITETRETIQIGRAP